MCLKDPALYAKGRVYVRPVEERVVPIAPQEILFPAFTEGREWDNVRPAKAQASNRSNFFAPP